MNLENNLKTLEKVSFNLCEKIKESNCNFVEIIKAKNGKNNMLVRKHNRPTLAYPEKDPVKAAKLIGGQKIFHKDTATVLLGLGLGHTVFEILKKMEKGHKVIVIEPVLGIIKLAFTEYDFSKYIKDGSLYIATNQDDVTNIITICDQLYVIQDWMNITEQYIMLCEEYKDICQYALEIINQLRCNVGTVMGAGQIIAENDIKNLPYVIRHRGVDELKDKFKGKPAISVNTGPSLAKNIHLLKEVQGNAVIIAVAQALRLLLAYGIKPDFICTVDYGKVNEEHFKGLFDEKDVNLVCLNRTYAPIIKKWQGAKFIAATYCPGFDDFSKVLQSKGFLEQGGSVSHMNLGLALHMGCDPIMVIGQDFAYSPDNLSHIEQVDAGGKVEVKDGMLKWKVKDPRSSIKKGIHEMGQSLAVDGYFGDDVMTNAGLASFILAFERIIKDKPNKVIDCTEGGSYKKGTIRMTLDKAIGIYLKKPVDKTIITPLKTLIPDSDIIPDAIKLLESDIDNLKDITKNADLGLETVESVKLLIKKRNKSSNKDNITKQIDDMLVKNKEYSLNTQTAASKNNLIGVSIFQASRQIHSRHMNVNSKNIQKLNKQDDLIIRISRNELILKAAKDAALKLMPSYKKTLAILKQYQETKDESLLSDNTPELINLHDADKYFKVGNWTHPLIDSEKYLKIDVDNPIAKAVNLKAKSMRSDAIIKAIELQKKERRQDLIDYNELCEKAYSAGRNGKDFHAAINYLKKAEKLFTDKHRARWGLATTYYKLGDVDKSCKYYDNLVSDFPEILQFEFERGLVYLNQDIKTGFKHLQNLLAKTEFYDYFLLDLAKLYIENKMYKEAKTALEGYIKKYPGDYKAKELQDKLNDK